MSENLQKWLLRVTGAVTMLAILQSIAPALYLKINGLSLADPVGLLYARHWGVMAFVFGVLLILAAERATLRPVIVTAALVEKAGLVLFVATGWGDPALAGFRGAACVDTICVVLYIVLLGSIWRKGR
jgi:hypothetical protein